MMRVLSGLTIVALAGAWAAPDAIAPDRVETRTVNLQQTVTLHDIPKGAKVVKMWVPVPSDTSWQRVVDLKVESAPGSWSVVPQEGGRGNFVYAELKNPSSETASVVVSGTVVRKGVHFPLEKASTSSEIQAELFEAELDQDAPLMEVDDEVRAFADKACGTERDPAKQAILLQQAVAKAADHYSKDATKPVCGRGAASDCMEQGGGCCTDLHSLFIAAARARGIPARMQYGYRMLDAKAGAPFDPGYRCWVEYFVPGAGWVPTDVVASDNADAANPVRWASLSATRVWLWSGRSFELTPKADAGPIDTMTCGWAEIDGKPINPVPSRDGKTPAQLRRTVQFEIVTSDRPADAPKLPE